MKDDPLDTALLYQPDNHVTEHDMNRFSSELMGDEELNAFLYHIDECPACREFVHNMLKKKRIDCHKID